MPGVMKKARRSGHFFDLRGAATATIDQASTQTVPHVWDRAIWHTTQPAGDNRDVFGHVPAYDLARRRQPGRLRTRAGIRPSPPAATGTSSDTCRHTTTSPAATGTSSDTCRHTTQPAGHDRDVFGHVPAYDHLAGGNRDVFGHVPAYDPARRP